MTNHHPDLHASPTSGAHPWTDAPLDGARRAQKVSELIAMQIVEEIVESAAQPGDHLPLEAEMVEQYQVSRASLREALRLLEVQGLITLRPGRGGGPVVGSARPEFLARTTTLYFGFDGTTFDDLFTGHLLLEVETAGLAAANPDRELVRDALAPFVDLAVPDDLHERHVGYRNFHGTIRQIGGNRVVDLLAGAVSHVVTTHVLASMEPTELRERIDAEHRQLAQLIIDADVDGARSLMREHFQVQIDHYRQHWPQRLRQPIEWR